MKFNPEEHDRKSYRLKGYDYTQPGFYFITICCANRECFFGCIENDEIIFNAIGKIANEYWSEIPKHFPNTILHEYIVMPNHVHGIIELIDHSKNDVGKCHEDGGKCHDDVGTCHDMSLHHHVIPEQSMNNVIPKQNKFSKPILGSISVIIQQYKASVKRWCNKNGNEEFQWQSRFHDSIVRDEHSVTKITKYIIDNPKNWGEDLK